MIFLAITSVFIVEAAEPVTHQHFGFGQQLTMMLAFVITSKGLAGVPRINFGLAPDPQRDSTAGDRGQRRRHCARHRRDHGHGTLGHEPDRELSRHRGDCPLGGRVR